MIHQLHLNLAVAKMGGDGKSTTVRCDMSIQLLRNSLNICKITSPSPMVPLLKLNLCLSSSAISQLDKAPESESSKQRCIEIFQSSPLDKILSLFQASIQHVPHDERRLLLEEMEKIVDRKNTVPTRREIKNPQSNQTTGSKSNFTNKKMMNFEEFKRLKVKSFEEYKSDFDSNESEESLEKGYSIYCRSRYNGYLRDVEGRSPAPLDIF